MAKTITKRYCDKYLGYSESHHENVNNETNSSTNLFLKKEWNDFINVLSVKEFKGLIRYSIINLIKYEECIDKCMIIEFNNYILKQDLTKKDILSKYLNISNHSLLYLLSSMYYY